MSLIIETPFTKHANVEVPVICGPMYPCSNLELVAAVSKAGGLGVVQPVSLTFVHKQDFRQALRDIKAITDNPIGMNAHADGSYGHAFKTIYTRKGFQPDPEFG